MENTAIVKAEKNVETITRGYEAFNKGDLETLATLFHENASWHTPGESSMSADYNGRDAIFAHFARLAKETNNTIQATLRDVFISETGRVIGIHHNTGTRNGMKLDIDTCLVFEFRDGRIIDGREFVYDLYAADKFWR